jgi:hypothetical protein
MNVDQIIFKLFVVVAWTAEVEILGFLSAMFSDYGLLGLIPCSLISVDSNISEEGGSSIFRFQHWKCWLPINKNTWYHNLRSVEVM